MVRERKIRMRDIEKLHEIIDSASLPKQRTVSSSEAEKLELLRKRLSDDPFNTPRHSQSPDSVPSQSAGMQPRVVVHKPEDTQKKDEKVIQIDLGPRSIKKEKEQPLINFLPVKEDPFAKESLFEIEKITAPKKSAPEGNIKNRIGKTISPKRIHPRIISLERRRAPSGVSACAK